MSAPAPSSPTEIRTPPSPRKAQATSDIPHRTQSVNSRGFPSPTLPHRSLSQSQGRDRPPSASRQAAQLVNVARRDYDQSSLARSTSQHRRSSSADRQNGSRVSSSIEPPRAQQRGSSRSGTARQSMDAAVAQPVPNGTNAAPPTAASGNHRASYSNGAAPQQRRRTEIEAQTGVWQLGKTIGQGSMGRVKLAKNRDTGEQVAIKIVPRQSQDEHRSQQDRERADKSKEIRTAREAAIVSLVNHPYICGMRDVVRTGHHWYMLFEYVNGGQMLDYIISHGKLKEKVARKFARQVASALDYCHHNSIVHRDLKIENILISKEGNIKIIDFGLSNLFSPRSLLNTFCGSLYFAAPELLQAKQYTGPEVDVWSFGIVLYVLVCGKVPFDDQSMPQLHSKIKKGVVEYPPWLSTECKHIISRMLVTDPRQRASLTEILNHPWMNKGYNGPPENFLPHREPLQLPLDPQIIEKMVGFDFGPADYITNKLESIIQSEDYQRVVRQTARKQQGYATDGERKKSMFDFYQRRKSSNSRDTLSVSSSEALNYGEDPVNAYSPLISIYYLVREKQERERLQVNPGALVMPQSPGEAPLQMPDLPAPQVAHTNPTSFEMAGEPSPGIRTRPRARTQGEDDITEGTPKASSQPPASTVKPPVHESVLAPKKDGGAVGLLRRLSTRRGREPEQSKPATQPPPPSIALSSPEGAISPEGSVAAPRKSFSVRKNRDRDTPPSAYRPLPEQQQQQPDLLAPPSPGEGMAKKLKGLGRSASVNSSDLRRRWSRRQNHESANAAAASDSERSSFTDQRVKLQQTQAPSGEPINEKSIPGTRARSQGHSRRGSLQTARPIPLMEDGVPEETDQELAEEMTNDQRSNTSQEMMKPVFLKGLFSVSTTSSKPLSFIRADLIRVLKQLGVDYKEIKGGFSCRHVPSIDLNRVVDNPPAENRISMSTHRRKISFAGILGNDSGRGDEMIEKMPPTPRTPSRRPPDSSYTGSEASDEDVVRKQARSPRAAGETSTQVQSDLGQSMILRFEILVVKVPIVSLHGLQFKKVDGGTWQYKKMAETILAELRL